ncbi:MAG TPA: type II toxin-antitoxin system prevent-host-death family antitoxin [Thermoanaerobaculia bacterium]|nr:type II toxin-antitoxin system prevent-host-death family antitoxin [Thermoanaerobaculia bacterium]
MKIYTYSEARRNLAKLLEEAARTGEVRIQRRDGKSFVVRPEQPSRSPFDVEGVDLGLKREQILRAIHESRKK